MEFCPLPIIKNNFEMPYYRLLGNRDASDIHGRVNFLTRLNMKFYEYAQTHENFYICDINYPSADYGLREWSDPFYYHMYKYALNVNAIPYLSFSVENIIKSLFGKNKKGLVLDLDNTLWGGIIGDDGVDGIAVGPEEPEGQAYMEFQRYLRDHKQLGVILNVESKNDHGNATAGLNHSDGVMKPESLVFVDGNPAEWHIMSAQLPGVCVPEIGSVHLCTCLTGAVF